MVWLLDPYPLKPESRGYVLILSMVVLSVSTGCAAIHESPMWPSYTRPYCYPSVKYSDRTKKSFLGARCKF